MGTSSGSGLERFRINQPYARGLKRLKEEVLEKTDFDPATLWQWGTMQAVAVIEILKDCEKQFGAEGQKVVCQALQKVGLDVGRQILKGLRKPESMTEEEFLSFVVTVINRIAYASLEDPKIDGPKQVSFEHHLVPPPRIVISLLIAGSNATWFRGCWMPFRKRGWHRVFRCALTLPYRPGPQPVISPFGRPPKKRHRLGKNIPNN